MVAERLQKLLSNAGIASRRVAEEMILAGRITVNGRVEDVLGARADLEVDEVMVDGVPLRRDRYRYFMLHKPAGFVTTARDEEGRPTVLDLVPIGELQLHPVGRLDLDSEGLLILTTDGHLTDLLTHPRNEVEKEYLVGIDSPLSKEDCARLVRGIQSEGERLRAKSARGAVAPVDSEDAARAPAWATVVLAEGRKREVRRMMAAAGKATLALKRVRVGPLHLGDLGSGAFRELEDSEVKALYGAALGRRP